MLAPESAIYLAPALRLALWFLILSMLILLPMIPAIIIYKTFPDSGSEADGALGPIKLKASGAFGGYMIVLAVFIFTPLSPRNLLQSNPECGKGVWTVRIPYDDTNIDKDFFVAFDTVPDHRYVANDEDGYLEIPFASQDPKTWNSIKLDMIDGSGGTNINLTFEDINSFSQDGEIFIYGPVKTVRLITDSSTTEQE